MSPNQKKKNYLYPTKLTYPLKSYQKPVQVDKIFPYQNLNLPMINFFYKTNKPRKKSKK